jgi:hypothetical protein
MRAALKGRLHRQFGGIDGDGDVPHLAELGLGR